METSSVAPDPAIGADDTPLTADPYLKLEDGGTPPAPKRVQKTQPPSAPLPPPPIQGANFVASQRDPERWAKVTQLADRLHVDTDYVDRNFEELSKGRERQALTRATTNISPTLAQWYSNPDNATIAQRELEPLSRVDAAAKILAASGSDDGVLGQIKEGVAGFAGQVRDFFSDWKGPARAAQGLAHGIIDPIETVRKAALPFRIDETNALGVPIRGHLAAWGTEGYGNTPLGQYASAAAQALTLAASGPVSGVVKETIASKLGTGLLARAVANVASEEAVAIPFGAEADPNKPLRGATAMALLAPTLAGAGHLIGEGVGASMRPLFHPDPLVAASEATVRTNDALRSIHDATALAEIGRAAKEAKSTASVPSRLKSLVETATGGSDAATVYFQSEDWDKHWTEKGIDPATAAADVMGDEGRAYADAKTTGSDLAIPLGDYISKVAPTEHWDGLLESARTKPGGMSFREADEYLKALPNTMKELSDEAGKETETTAAESSSAKVGQNVEEQLIGSGVSPTAARAQAQMYEAAFRTLGARAGVDPLELYNRYGLNVRRVTPEEATARVRAAEEAASKTPPTIRDESGKLRRNLKEVPTEHLTDELGKLAELNASEEALHAAIQESGYRQAYLELPATERKGRKGQEDLPDADGEMDPDVLAQHNKTVREFNARQVVRAAREKAIGRIQAELARRGIAAPTIEGLNQAASAGGARGRFAMSGKDRTVNIELLAKADRSTFLHETGHFYLEILNDLAKRPDVSPEILADHQAIRKWLGAEGDARLTREQHEQFARGFEAYLMEGKAPSAELRGAFYRFKNWLTNVYKSIKSLNVELTPEVRAVFDRMLASKEEIAAQERAQHVEPLFPDPVKVGMSEGDAASYLKAVADAHEAAEEELTTRMMKEIRREESAEWSAWEEPVRAEVEASVNQEPTYKAMEAIRKGTQPDGTPLPEGTPALKLDRAAVKAILGENSTPFVRKGMTALDGMPPDVVAEMFGFGSGKELVETLAKAPSRERAIREAVDARMQAEHGERMTQSEILDKATEALHGEKRMAVLRKELQHLMKDDPAAFKKGIRAVTKVIPADEAVKAQARGIIAGKVVREIRPDLYEKAAARVREQALNAMLAGDTDKAFALKTQERLLTEVYRAAVDAKAEVSDALDTFKKMFRSDKSIAETRDMDLVNAARSVLATYGIGSSKRPASSFLESVRAYDPETADVLQAMVNDATEGADNYQNLSVDDFRGMTEAVTALWNKARTDRQYEVDGKREDIKEVRDRLIARAEQLRTSDELPGYRKKVTDWERVKAAGLSFRSAARRVEHWVRAFDGGDPMGEMRRLVWNRISEAADNFRLAKKRAVTEYANFLDELASGDMPITRSKIPAPELGYTFSGHNELLGALLHRGNGFDLGSNGAKLILGRGWGEVEEHTIGQDRTANLVNTSRWDSFEKRMRDEGVLTKAHYDFVQGVWDRMEGLKPDAQKAHRQLYGRYFAERTAVPFENEFGRYAGGYFPAKADPEIVKDAEARADRDALLGENNSFMFPSVGKGFTKERVKGYNKPLMLDASAVPQHFDAVVRFSHLGPAVHDVARLFVQPSLRDALQAIEPSVMTDMLTPWLQRAAQQRSELTPVGGRFWKTANNVARAVRNNAALQIMAANSTVLLEQLTHFPSVFVRVDKGKIASATWDYLWNHKQIGEDVAEESKFMATRESAALTEAHTQVNKILLDPTVFQSAKDFSNAHGRFLMAGVQSVMDHIVYRAAKDQALEKGMEPADAIREAESTVRELLGSYNPEDISHIEGGTPVQRLFTMFYGFFNTKANVLHTQLSIAKQVGLRKDLGRVTGAVFWGFMVPAIMGEAIKQKMSGKPFEEDDEGTLHAILRHFGLAQLEMGARMVPFGGQAVAGIQVAFGGKTPDVLSSPALKMLGDAVFGTLSEGGKMARGGELTTRGITDFFTLLGMVSGLPLRPIAKPVGYLHDVHTGKAQPSGAFDFTRGLLTGQNGNK